MKNVELGHLNLDTFLRSDRHFTHDQKRGEVQGEVRGYNWAPSVLCNNAAWYISPFHIFTPLPPHPSNDVAATVVVCTQDGKLFSSKSFRLIITFSLFLSFFLSFSLSLSAVYLNLSLSSLFISLSVFLFVYFLSILLISIFSCHNFSSRTYVGYVYLFDVFVSVHCAVLAIWLVCFVFWVLGTFMHLLACSLIILSTYVFSVLTSANLSSKLHVNVTVNRLIDSI